MHEHFPLTVTQERWLNVAIDLAEQSECRQRHGAIIVQRSSVLGVGINKARNHPKYTDQPDHFSEHAEMAALRKVIKRASWTDLSRAVCYVARVAKDGTLRLSRPCDRCWVQLNNAGIRTVVFTTTNGGVYTKWQSG